MNQKHLEVDSHSSQTPPQFGPATAPDWLATAANITNEQKALRKRDDLFESLPQTHMSCRLPIFEG